MATSALFRTEAQHDVLRELVRAVPGSRTAADLARSLGRPESSVTREVARLVADGLVTAEPQGRRRLLHPNYADPFMRALRDAFDQVATIEAERDRQVRWWLTLPEVAERIGELLRDQEPDQALRILLDTVDQLPLVAALGRLHEMLDAPGTTGDERWDALLAGSVRHHLRLLGAPAPAWSVRDPLASWWWPSGRGARAVLAMQRTPPELARLGIWFDARNFAAG
jgi:DNA-binding transcriptional ArsR family regulator